MPVILKHSKRVLDIEPEFYESLKSSLAGQVLYCPRLEMRKDVVVCVINSICYSESFEKCFSCKYWEAFADFDSEVKPKARVKKFKKRERKFKVRARK